MPDEPVLAIL